LTKGGPAQWGEPLATRGELGKPNGAFAVDTLTMPYENPWHALLFSGDLDFFPNGDAAVGTVHGDVWRVRGIDDKLEHLTWQRIATGLFQPLGLKIIDGKVYVLGRDQITILEDLNGDGETDHYINFNNDAEVDSGGHGYATCLETDRSGNFYSLRCASGTAHGGSLLRISRDGAKLEVIATGFRNPNGLGVGPDDSVTVADQEGNWVPSTRLDLIHPGGFYGYMPMHHRAETPKIFDAPLCWMPKSADNSAASQVWVPAGKWGALAGQMLHLSYGHSSLLLVVRDPISPQGGVVPLPVRFISGAMRGRFNPHDGQLYVTGLRGWQTAALRDGCFQRVRCLPEKLHLPVAIAAYANGLRVTFSEPLDRATAEDPGSYDETRWNYRWAESYGSKDWSVSEPQKEGRDSVTIASAKVAPDGRSVFLAIPDLRPAMQMQLRYNVNTAAGQTVTGEIDHTINQLAPALETP
jgi:sugar lactone lactonase YvrE